MSKIRKEIERYMNGPVVTDSMVTSNFMFPPEFIGFQGHFPINKLLPGACQIQCAISTIEKALEKRVVLKEILLAKYLAPILPGDNVSCTVNLVPDSGSDFICKVRITKGPEKVTELKIRIVPGDAL